ncbi:MAG: ABC transporter substrate-binding protein [Gammaproteobacteria bacterium]|nr:ABC transporter substrate-binding protein [Gammaproteobacteria bacterium]
MRTLRLILIALAVALAPPAPAGTSPTELVFGVADQVVERLRTGRPLSDDQAYDLVEDLILPHLDFEAFSRLTLGKHWRQASPEQREAFTREFKSMLMHTYASSLNTYAGETFEHVGERSEGDGRVLVQTRFVRVQGEPVRVDYRLHRRDGEWKIYDVVIEGVSLVLNYRSSFGEEISRGGLDRLIQRMADKEAKPPPVKVP